MPWPRSKRTSQRDVGALSAPKSMNELGSARALRVELAERSVRVRHALAVYETGAPADAKGDEACVAARTGRL